MAPPNSYILVEDFVTPEALVEYLDYLDHNDTAYMEYHTWRNTAPNQESKKFEYTNTSGISEEHHYHNDALSQKTFCNVCKTVKKRKDLGSVQNIF